MQQGRREAGLGLQRMAEGMAEIEQRPLARLALVAGDDARLGLAAVANRLGTRLAIAIEQRRSTLFQPGEEFRVVDQPILHDLGIARGQFPARQARQKIGIRQHQTRLVEAADQILAMRHIDAGLAADRTVDLRQKGRRNLQERHAAQQDRGGESGQVADHAAAEGEQRRRSFRPRIEYRREQLFQLREALAALARRHPVERMSQARRRQRVRQGFAMQLRHRLVGHHEQGGHLQQRLGQRAGAGQQAGAGMDVIAALTQLEPDGRGGKHHSHREIAS